MISKKHDIGFFTPNERINKSFFGAATFGIAHQEFDEIYSRQSIFLPYPIDGIKITGSYDHVLTSVRCTAKDVCISAAIVLLGNSGGENNFINTLSALIHCPIVGGGAAINLQTGESGLLDEIGQEVSILLIIDRNYQINISHKNIHNHIVSEHRLSFVENRILEKIDGVDAAAWLRDKKIQLGYEPDDYEHITFATKAGINAHLSYQDGKIISGRDLHEVMDLRMVKKEDVQPQIQAFYQDENAIIFGCAGLRGILPKPFTTDSVGLFMFGEVCYAEGKADFGNLMLSKIQFIRK